MAVGRGEGRWERSEACGGVGGGSGGGGGELEVGNEAVGPFAAGERGGGGGIGGGSGGDAVMVVVGEVFLGGGGGGGGRWWSRAAEAEAGQMGEGFHGLCCRVKRESVRVF